MWVHPEFKKKMHVERAIKGYSSILEYTRALSDEKFMFEEQKKENVKKNPKKQKPFSFF